MAQSTGNYLFDGAAIELGFLPLEAPTPPSGLTGQVKIRLGGAWVPKPMKIWDGSAWVIKPVKVFDGVSFVETTY